MTLRELYEKAASLSRQERINLAGGSGKEILDFLKSRGLSDEDRFRFLMYLVALFAGADGVIDADEHRLFADLLDADWTREQLQENLKGLFNAEFVDQMDKLIDGMPEDQKWNCCLFGLAFVSADGTISAREQQVFEKILA